MLLMYVCIIQEANFYASKEGLIFLETSAATGQNVYKLFENIGTNLLAPVLFSP